MRWVAQVRAIGLIVTMLVHDYREAHCARRAGADAALVSPLHPTCGRILAQHRSAVPQGEACAWPADKRLRWAG